jgi:type IV pilus assembly protein PilC
MVSRKKNSTERTFAYEVIDPDGKRKKGRLEAASRNEALTLLRSPGWVILKVEEAGIGNLSSLNLYDVIPGLTEHKVKATTLASFSRRLHQLLRAGLTVTAALRTLAESDSTSLAGVYRDLAERVSAGSTLANAMGAYPAVFPEMVVAYIHTAESTGTMSQTTARLAKMLERRANVERRVKAVAAYPVLVSVIITIVVIGLLLFVVPRFSQVYESFGAELPWVTQMLQRFAPLAGFGTLLAGLGFFLFLSMRRAGRLPENLAHRYEKFLWKLPIFGKVSRDLALYRFTSVLAGAVGAGLRISEAVTLAGRASNSAQMQRVAPNIAESIAAGRALSSTLLDHPEVFPADFRALVLTGERAGDLETLLDSLTLSLDEEIDAEVTGLGAKIEVLLLVVMVVIVGGILVTLYLPVLNLARIALRGLSEVDG